MPHRNHVFGALGSGTTTLGSAVAAALEAKFLDSDAYYWFPADPPFTRKRVPARLACPVPRIDAHRPLEELRDLVVALAFAERTAKGAPSHG